MVKKIPYSYKLLLYFIVICFCSIPSSAQSRSEENDIFMYRLFVNIDNVSLEKIPESPDELPVQVIVITAAQLKLFNYQTLGEVLRSVTGCFTGNDQLMDQFIFRGIGTPYDYNTRVLVLIDGHTLNECIGNSALDVGEGFLIPMESIEQIEIIKGPASVIYGTSAFLGIINVKTKEVLKKIHIEGSVRYGSLNSKSYHLLYGYNFENGLNMLLSSSAHKTDGDKLYFENFENEIHRGFFNKDKADNENYFLKMKYCNLQLSGVSSHFHKNFGGSQSSSVFESDLNYQNEYRRFLEIKYDRPLFDNTHMYLRAFYDYYDYLDSFDYLPVEPQWYDILLCNTYGMEILGVFKRWENNRITSSLELSASETEIKNGNVIPDETPYAIIKKSFYLLKYFIKDDFEINDNLTLLGGVQFNHHELFQDGLMFRGGTVYKLNNDNLLKLVFHQGFRTPTVFEAYYFDNEKVKNNPDLKREKVDTTEILYEKKWGDKINFSSSLYFNQFKDLIYDAEYLNPETNLIEQYINSDAFHTRGIEITFKYSSRQGNEMIINGALQDDCGNDLVNFPKYLFNVNASVPVFNEFILTSACNYVGKRKTRDLITEMDPYFNLDSGILTKKYFNTIDIWLGVKNILDEEIQTALGNGFPSLKSPFRGRTWLLKITASM